MPPSRSPLLQSGGQNEKGHTTGQGGYITHAAWGIPTASERGAKSEVAHKWARWLHHPCRLGGSPPLQRGGQNQKWPTSGQGGYITPAASGDSHRFRAGGRIRSGPQVGKVATSPLPPWGIPTASEPGGKNKKWPTSGQGGYITIAAFGIPTASERGAKSELAHKWARWLHNPCRLGGSQPLQSGGQNEKWSTTGQGGYITIAASGDPHRFRGGGKIRSGPQVGKVATSPLPPRGSPSLQSGGAKSEVAHKWARWLRNPCRMGDPHRFRAGGRIRSGPQVGKVATSPLPPRGSPSLQSGGQNQKWPTSGQGGYINLPSRGDPHRFRAGGKIRGGPQVGKVAKSPLPLGGSQPFQSGGQNQKWPISGQGGHITLAASGIPTASEPGAKSEVAHKWARWLHHPCRLGDPHRFRAGGKIRMGPQGVKVAT